MITSKRVTVYRVCLLALLTIVLCLGACGGKQENPAQLIAKAKEEREKGNYNAAIIHLKNVLQESPDHAEARFQLGTTYSDAGNLALAETDLRRALELGYDQTKIIPVLGKSLLMMGEFQKVLDKVRAGSNFSSQLQAEILTLRALATIGLKRRSEARQLLEQALTIQPEFAGALLVQARLEAEDMKLDDSARLIERALASAPNSIEAFLLKGDLGRMRADEAGAIAAYQKVLELNPKNVPAHLSIASLQIEAGSVEEAGKHIEQVRKLAPGNPMSTYLRALIEFRKRNFLSARELILQVLKAAPNHMQSVLLAGALEFELGSHNQAQSYLGQVLAQAPGNLYARKLLITSLAKSGRVGRALEVLRPALEQAQDDGGLLTLAGDLYLESNDFAKAGQYFDKAARLDPKSAGARTGLALSRLGSGETVRGLADLESAVQLDPGKYQADIMLVMAQVQRAHYDEALKAIATLEKKQPNNPLTYNLKASIFSAKKDYATARKHLEHALELQPTYVPAAVNLAQIDLQEKNPKLARQRLEVILEKDKNNVQALLALSNLAPRIGATSKEAIAWLERAANANPGLVQPQLILARAYAKQGEVKKALEIAQRAQAANPENPECLDTLGMIQISAGQKEQALATYDKLAKLQPDSAPALYQLAMAQAASADVTTATSTLKKVLSLKPDFQDAQRALVELEVRVGHYPEALKIAQQVQKQVAKSPLGYVLEGDVRMAEKNYPQAIKSYESAFGVGKSGALLIKLHAASILGGRRTEAESRLAQWVKDFPEDVGVRLYAAEVNLQDGNYKRAIEQYEALLVKQPENVTVLNNLSWAYQQTKDSRALRTAERAYQLMPNNVDIADTLGWMLSEQGDTSRGVELLQKAVAAAPGAQMIRYHLAQTYLKMGDKAKARAELERIQSTGIKFPQEAEAMNLLKQLRN